MLCEPPRDKTVVQISKNRKQDQAIYMSRLIYITRQLVYCSLWREIMSFEQNEQIYYKSSSILCEPPRDKTVVQISKNRKQHQAIYMSRLIYIAHIYITQRGHC